MKDYEIKHLKKLLEKNIADETKKEDEHKNLMKDGSLKEGLNELSTYDNHPADLGSETFEMEKQFALKQHQKNIKKDLEDALSRIETGKYGICEFCGKEIGFERLEVVPTARLCIKCEKERKLDIEDLEYDAPVEEDLLSVPFARTFNDSGSDHDDAAYDGEDAWQDVQQYSSSSGPQDLGVNRLIDYNNDFYDSDEDVGYVEDVEKISNAQYKSQLPDFHGDSYEGYVKKDEVTEDDIDYFGEKETTDKSKQGK